MSITVIAHFNDGEPSLTPDKLKGVASESVIFKLPTTNEGGVFVSAFDTDDIDNVILAFEEHLADCDLSALAIHKTGETQFCYSKTQTHIF